MYGCLRVQLSMQSRLYDIYHSVHTEMLSLSALPQVGTTQRSFTIYDIVNNSTHLLDPQTPYIRE